MAATCLRCGREIAVSGGSLLCADCLQAQPRVSVTAVLIVINLIVFIVMAISGVSLLSPTLEALLHWGASYGPYDLTDGWWRLFTSMFVHIGIIHILLNMYCLTSLGPLAETIFGSGRFLALYVLSGVAGTITSAGVHPQTVSAGASGAIFGVAGALAAVIYVSRNPLFVSARGRLSKTGIGTFVVYNLFYGFANAGIDNSAHIGGLATGFLMGLTLPVGAPLEPERPFRTGLVFLGTVVALCGGFAGVRQWRHGAVEVELARRDFQNDHYPEGMARLQNVLKTEPQNFDARVLLGAAYLDQRKLEDAIQELERARQQDSTKAWLYDQLGYAHLELKQWDQAVTAYKRATVLDPQNAAAWGNLGVVYINSNRDSAAIAPLVSAIALQPDTARHYYNVGLAYLGTKQYRSAVNSFDHAVKLRPEYPQAVLQRGSAYQELGRRDSARADYQRVLKAADAPDAVREHARRLLAALPHR